MFDVIHKEKSANGTETGSESSIVNGWTMLSNCDAKIMYMKMTDSKNAQMNSLNVRSSSRARPDTLVV